MERVCGKPNGAQRGSGLALSRNVEGARRDAPISNDSVPRQMHARVDRCGNRMHDSVPRQMHARVDMCGNGMHAVVHIADD